MGLKIGIFGGTFDPPHRGHIEAANSAFQQLSLDRMLVIPTGIPPHKEFDGRTPAETRLEMTKIAFASLPFAQVSDMEIRRDRPSYTIDTLEELKKQYPDDEFYLLIGTDMLLTFEKWNRFTEILTAVELAVFCRYEGETETIANFADYLQKTYGGRVHLVENAAVPISSSQLRSELPQRRGREFLWDAEYSYIVCHRLYGVKPEFDWLREKAYAMLQPKRIPHVAGCEEEAVRLASRWGADPDSAREAAILHDITKKCDREEQLKFCEKYGIINDNVEKAEGKLLHAKTGAAIARAVFGVTDEVYSAIFWHTTGRENMTLLEKIIYMADYIEPNRDFPGVEKLRQLAYSDLNAAMLLGYKMSMEDLRQRGIVPHERTEQAMNWLQQQQRNQ